MTSYEQTLQTANTPHHPTPRDVLLLDAPSSVRVSPGGSKVAVTVQTTNWKDDRYTKLCYVYILPEDTTYQLNREGDIKQVEWIDDRTLALLKQGQEENAKAQIWLYEGLIGEGWQVTNHETGVEWFKPYANGMLFRARHPEREKKKSRTDRFGKFVHFEQEESTSALYYIGLEDLRQYQAQVKAATEEKAEKLIYPVVELSRLLAEPLSIQHVVPFPTHDAIIINCWKRDDLVYHRETSAYYIKLNPKTALSEHVRRQKTEKDTREKSAPKDTTDEEDRSYLGEITRLHLPKSAYVTTISPDGNNLLVGHKERDGKMYTRQDLWTINLKTALAAIDTTTFLAGMRNITATLDRQVLGSYWTESGIFGLYPDGTNARLAQFGEDGHVEPVDLPSIFPTTSFHISDAGLIGFVGASTQTFPEVYVASHATDQQAWDVKQLSNFGQAVENWDWGTMETIQWESRDGTLIEGVLHKPSDFDATRKYPLVFIVHGGPRSFSAEYPFTYGDKVYSPTVQFVNKGMLVLKPNYRGSIGRGQAFSELNVNNLGVGDLWDLESAIEHLDAKGWVDTNHVGCMGWSQGGYISAFAGLHSDKFRAVSVGAGISDWYTYHISNDIPDFTVDYLSDSPFRDREVYVKTAPISNIGNAKTPMLIQHGSEDRRVPFSNAMELYRGLKAQGVPVELFVFPGMGHPITKPRENHAVMYQNLAWFSHYLLDEELELE